MISKVKGNRGDVEMGGIGGIGGIGEIGEIGEIKEIRGIEEIGVVAGICMLTVRLKAKGIR